MAIEVDYLGTGIDGLDLVLGGAMAVVQKWPGVDPSVSVLIRGAAGTGKTILGAWLAASLARGRTGDVLYVCVELLPTELAAQLASFHSAPATRIWPFEEPSKPGAAGTLYVAMAPVEELRTKPAETIDGLLDAVSRAGGVPKVIVVDSVSEGYGLGASAPRVLVDEICKAAAERGKCLVVLEEVASAGASSSWPFATDVVLELASPPDVRPQARMIGTDRMLVVAKNRFGASEAGPHGLDFVQDGPRVIPATATYLRAWAVDRIVDALAGDRADHTWNVPELERASGWRPLRGSIVGVYGSEPSWVVELAARIGAASPSDALFDVWVDLAAAETRPVSLGSRDVAVSCGSPFMNGPRVFGTILTAIGLGRRREGMAGVRRILVGDLQALRRSRHRVEVRDAITVLTALAREADVPVILYETSTPRAVASADAMGGFEAVAAEPPVVDWCDVVLEIRQSLDSISPSVAVTDRRTGRRIPVGHIDLTPR